MKIRLRSSKLAGGLGLLLALVLIIALGVPAGANFFPSEFHQFLGSVKICDELVLTGDVTVNIEEDTTVVWTTTTPINASGNYGYAPDYFTIPIDDPATGIKEGGVDGDTVRFYVQGRLAGTFIFEAGQGTVLDLQVTDVYLVVNANPPAGGTVTGADTYTCGDDAPVEAFPAGGWEFTGWSDDLAGDVNPTTILMDGDKTVTATFTEEAAPDTTPPYTSGHDPAKGATGVAIDTNIVVHVLDDGDGVDIATIAMTVEGASVTPVITGTLADYTLTYDPPADFAYLQVVDVTVDASDLASPGNVMATDAYSFTTEAVDTTPPTTSGHDPAKGVTGVPIDTNIVVHVLDDGAGVDQTTIAMTVEGASVTPVITGTLADYTLTYDPPADFAYLQVVDVTVDASDLASPGNVMATDSYSFTTQGPPGFLSLVEGVNIIAYTGATAALPGALTNIGPGGLDVVDGILARGAWTDGVPGVVDYWLYYNARILTGTLSELEADRGYIIVVTEVCTWELP